ncbi:MAG: hypothetical protein HQL16_06335 [Candidatus Omnitrophica bacterium]|nr:hypothetical protein [Candidatus Omnitrophota bacterium]
MKMGKIIAMMITVCFLAGSAHAQMKKLSVDDVIAQLSAPVSLEPAQVSALKPIMESFQAQHDQIVQDLKPGENVRDARQKLRQLADEENQKVSAILSEDQMLTLKSLSIWRRHQMGRNPRATPSLPPPFIPTLPAAGPNTQNPQK